MCVFVTNCPVNCSLKQAMFSIHMCTPTQTNAHYTHQHPVKIIPNNTHTHTHTHTHTTHTNAPYRAAFTTKTVRVGENSVLFQIWDTAGQEKVLYIESICGQLCMFTQVIVSCTAV